MELLEDLSPLLNAVEPLTVDKVGKRADYELLQVSPKDTGGTLWCRVICVFHNAHSLRLKGDQAKDATFCRKRKLRFTSGST